MGKIILVLTAACLLATFMIISNSSFKTATSAPPKNEDVSKKTQNSRAIKREQDSRARIAKKAGANKSQRNKANNSDEGSVGVVADAEEEQNVEDPAHAIVKGDSTPVYTVNSRDSSVLWLLKKGDKVATDVEVIDGQGRWSIVKKGELTRPGFVLDENLQRTSTAKKTQAANRNSK